MKTGS